VSWHNCPMGQQRRTLATWRFAATKKGWHHTLPAVGITQWRWL
jgi:hypothetical protein